MHLTDEKIEILRMVKQGRFAMSKVVKYSDVKDLIRDEMITMDCDELTPKGRQALSEVWQDKPQRGKPCTK